eukprot:GGOE01020989.1.p1 GENE.GGOE01020989.1~~GGOE01020989.1.p1  ORF type:complete len:519 (-),score=131.73 GGOE01020989.1:257-1813(-)
MKDRGLKPCVVTFSTYLKGLCTTGSMEGAVAVLAEMDKVGVRPNLRTVNTYLRGCLMHGTVQGGITCFTQMKDRWGLEPDASALEYVVQLLCQVLRLKEARRIIRQMGECAAVSTHSLAHAYLCVSKAAILICDRQLAEKYMQRSQTCLERGSLDPLPPSNADCDAEGGKRAWGKKTDDLARTLSRETYLTHRVDSLRRELRTMSQFMAAHDPLPPSTKYLQRVVPFSPQVDRTSPASGLLRNAADAFGLLPVEDAGDALISSQKLRRVVQPDGLLDFARLFHDRSLPLKWEICSGTGEWAVAQAVADVGRANWLASELRYDRSHAALIHAVTNEVKNLALVVGDAAAVMRAHVAPGTAQHIFVMHPEPPQQLGAGADRQSEAHHLLTPAFVQDMGRALQTGGWLLVVTDSLWYGKLLWEEFAILCTEGEELEPFQPAGRHAYRTECKKAGKRPLCLFAGVPGEDCGIPAPSASSYFQRLKEKEKAARHQRSDTERYFLGLRKVSAPEEGNNCVNFEA